MGSPTATNIPAEILDGVISALMAGGVVAGEAFISAQDPALFGIPFVQWLLDQGVSYLAQILVVAGQKFTTEIVIDIQTNGEKFSVITTATALQFALGSGDQAAIQSASQALQTAYGALIHFDGSAAPR